MEIQRKGLEPDVITFSALFSACHSAFSFISARAVSEDNAEKSLQLLVEMQRKGLLRDVFTYGSLINARAKGYNAEGCTSSFRRNTPRAADCGSAQRYFLQFVL